MSWEALDLLKELHRFKQHCDFTFKGPPGIKIRSRKGELSGDKQATRAQSCTPLSRSWHPEDGDTPAENDTLQGVYAKYEGHVAPQRNEI